MTYSKNFEQWKTAIEALPLEEVKLPNQPIDDYVAAIEALSVAANEDREALVGVGLDGQLIDDLPSLAGALRYCQAEWMSVYRAREDARIEWQEQSPNAYALRDELLHHFTFAYRGHDDVLNKVRRIREGSSHADMVQDLIELAVLGEKNPEPLAAIRFDILKLEQARTLSHQMSVLLAAVNGSAEEGNQAKVMRDKAFTLLDEKAGAIREFGKYVFWKDEKKQQRYFVE